MLYLSLMTVSKEDRLKGLLSCPYQDTVYQDLNSDNVEVLEPESEESSGRDMMVS